MLIKGRGLPCLAYRCAMCMVHQWSYPLYGCPIYCMSPLTSSYEIIRQYLCDSFHTFCGMTMGAPNLWRVRPRASKQMPRQLTRVWISLWPNTQQRRNPQSSYLILNTVKLAAFYFQALSSYSDRLLTKLLDDLTPIEIMPRLFSLQLMDWALVRASTNMSKKGSLTFLPSSKSMRQYSEEVFESVWPRFPDWVSR